MALYGVEAVVRAAARPSPSTSTCSRASRRSRRATGGSACGRRCPGSHTLKAGAGHGGAAGRDDRHGHLRRRGRGAVWTSIAPDLADFFRDLGLSPQPRLRAGVPARADARRSLLVVRLLPARRARGAERRRRLRAPSACARAFVHTLVPIALAYVIAHYFTFLLFQRPGDRLPGLRPARRRAPTCSAPPASRSTTA